MSISQDTPPSQQDSPAPNATGAALTSRQNELAITSSGGKTGSPPPPLGFRAQARVIRQGMRIHEVGFLEWRFLDRLLMCSLDVGKRSAVITRRQHAADAEYMDRSNLHDVIKRLHQADVIAIKGETQFEVTAPAEWHLAKRQGPERTAVAEKGAEALDRCNEVQLLLSITPQSLNEALRDRFYSDGQTRDTVAQVPHAVVSDTTPHTSGSRPPVAQIPQNVALVPHTVVSDTTPHTSGSRPPVAQIPQNVALVPHTVVSDTTAPAVLKALRPDYKSQSFKLRENLESLKDALADIEGNDESRAMAGIKRILGEDVMEPTERNPLGDGGKWRRRWRSARAKTHRVMASVIDQMKAPKGVRAPGAYAEDLWGRFL